MAAMPMDEDELATEQNPVQAANQTTPVANAPALPGAAAVPAPRHISSAGAPSQIATHNAMDLLRERYERRNADIDTLGPQIAQRYEGIQKGYEGMQQGQSALVQLLHDTKQRLAGLQWGPGKSEQLSAVLGAVASARPGSGFGGAAGAGATMGAQEQEKLREAQLMREQLGAKYDIEAQQASQQGLGYGLQGQQAGLSALEQKLAQANTGADRDAQTLTTAALNSQRYDPQVQGQLAEIKARLALEGQLSAIRGGTGAGGQFDPKNPDTRTLAYATYQMEYPNPNPRMSPVQKAEYDDQLDKILAVNPDFQQGNKKIADKVRQQFDTDPRHGDQLRFINNVAGHLAQYNQLVGQTNNGQLPITNAMALHYGKAIGHPELTNLQSIQSFLGDELEKTVVPGNTTQAERLMRRKDIDGSLAPAQWAGRHTQYEGILGTQLADLHRQYSSSLHFMPKKLVDGEWAGKLTPEAQGLIQKEETRAQGLPRVATREDLDALQSGDHFIGPDGNERIKH